MENEFLCPFKNINTCENIPTVPYHESWRGNTGYIDEININDPIFTNGPVAKFNIGNKSDRLGLAIKYQVICPDYPENNGEYAVATFKRFTGDDDTWVFGGHSMPYGPTVGKVSNFTWLENLVLGKEEKFIFTHYSEDQAIEDECLEECTITLAGHKQDIDKAEF